ncbi:hypothetical protein HZS_1411 [Henneguya salminicola]|nr:hypothetical protein HZS_1411 [Henneguya salminicola]
MMAVMSTSSDYWALKYFIKASEKNKKAENSKAKDSKEYYDKICEADYPKTLQVDHLQQNVLPDEKSNLKINKDLKNFFFNCCHHGDWKNVEHILKNVDDIAGLIYQTDQYNWSPLMCAISSGSIDSINILIKYGAFETINHIDAGGNSAEILLKNLGIDKFLNFRKANDIVEPIDSKNTTKTDVLSITSDFPQPFFCNICNLQYCDKISHQTSIIHLFNKNIICPDTKKNLIPPQYGIHKSNIGYQMLKAHGWDSCMGLGLHQGGRIYPIKAKPKSDRSGLGIKIVKCPKNQFKKVRPFTKQDEYEFRRSFM